MSAVLPLASFALLAESDKARARAEEDIQEWYDTLDPSVKWALHTAFVRWRESGRPA